MSKVEQEEIKRLKMLLGRYSLMVAEVEGSDFLPRTLGRPDSDEEVDTDLSDEECLEIKSYQFRGNHD